MLLTKLISLPISILLFLWMLRIKKNDPFPKGSVVKMIIAGALTTFGTTILTVLLGVIALAHRLGPDAIATILSDPNSEATANIAARLSELAGAPTLRSVFFRSFVLAAVIEEGLKYLAMRLCLRKSGVMKTRMDALVCGAIVGLAFQVLEDLSYASGNVVTAIFRAITPFHFTFGVIMGYYYGRSVETGKRSDRVKGLLIPILVHGLFDFSIDSLEINDYYIFLTLAVMLFTFVLTIMMILKIRRWSKNGTLSEPLYATETELPEGESVE